MSEIETASDNSKENSTVVESVTEIESLTVIAEASRIAVVESMTETESEIDLVGSIVSPSTTEVESESARSA